MRKLTIILIGLLNYTLTIGQTYSSIISDIEIYDFMNWMTVNEKKYGEEPILKRKQIYYKILDWETRNFIKGSITLDDEEDLFILDDEYLYNQEIDTIFKEQDKDYLFQQFTTIKDSIWHKSFSKSKLITDNKQKRPNRYYYSIPLFSLDKNFVIIHIKYYCGRLCAYGGYYVYKRLDKKRWIFITAVNTWIS